MSGFRSRRIEGLVMSEIRRMTRESNRVGAINLGQGICDMPTLPLVAEGAKAAIDARKSTYSYAEGALELRQAIAHKLARDNRMDVDPATEIVVTAGSSGAFMCALTGLLDAGDGILLLQPYYGYHLNQLLVSGMEPQFATLTPPDFSLTEEALRSALRDNTRALVLCTPCNPSGKMFSREEIEIVERVAVERELLLITDEIYEYFRYDGRQHISPATVGDLRARTVTIMGFSKTFSITGWRLGYAIAPPELARAMTLVNDLCYVCAPTPLQHALVEGLKAPESYYRDMCASFQGKRDRLAEALTRAGLTPLVPEGAYYMLADISALGCDNARDAAMRLLHETRVASIAGSAFYRDPIGETLVRFCFAKEDDVLDEACRRLADFRA